MDACLSILGVLFHILVHFSIVFCKTRTLKLREDKSQNDRIFFDGNIAAIETDSTISCANMCYITDKCMPMFYQLDTKQCVLQEFLGGYLKLHPSITTTASGWKYYEKQERPGVWTRIEGCLSNGFEYDPVEDACYIILTMGIDFDLINQYCTDLNSELIKITSQEKQDWVTSILATNTLDWVCIQGNNDNNMAEFRFNDGTPMTYFNWDSSARQPQGGGENYIDMLRTKSYRWHDWIISFPGY